jgi:ferredoxin
MTYWNSGTSPKLCGKLAKQGLSIMAENSRPLISLRINGQDISAPERLSVIQALWYAGYPRVKGVGCLQGVCGSCRVFVRRAGRKEVTTELGCELLIDEGMDVHFLSYPVAVHRKYRLEDLPSSWEVQAKFHDIFPEAAHCRHCNGCNTTCPKEIDVQRGVELAVEGRFSEAGEEFVECVMCNLCQTACPESIMPNHVALFARRVTAHFHTRPSNLINRLERMRKGELQVVE